MNAKETAEILALKDRELAGFDRAHESACHIIAMLQRQENNGFNITSSQMALLDEYSAKEREKISKRFDGILNAMVS